METLLLTYPTKRDRLNTLEVPDQGTVYWASFADIEKQTRNIDTAETAMPRKAQKKAAAAPEL